MKPWKQVSKKTILDYSKFLKVEEHCVELPDGRKIEEWPWIITPDYVNILTVAEDGQFIFFRQMRYSLQSVSLAPVGGYIEPGEDPLDCAKRELLEETGYEATRWTALGNFVTDSNRGSGKAWFFLAENARFSKRVESDDLEESELVFLSRQELDEALRVSGIHVLGWAACIYIGLRELDTRNQKA